MGHNRSHDNRHMLLMILCCLIPVAVLGAIFILKISAPQVVTYGLILLCPLSHVLMMGLMGRWQHNQRANDKDRPGAEPGVAQPTGLKKHIVSVPTHSRRHTGI